MGGTLLYKCRQCGKIDDSIHVPHGGQAIFMIRASGEYSDGYGSVLRITGTHNCELNTLGVTDLIGVKLDGYEEEKV